MANRTGGGAKRPGARPAGRRTGAASGGAPRVASALVNDTVPAVLKAPAVEKPPLLEQASPAPVTKPLPAAVAPSPAPPTLAERLSAPTPRYPAQPDVAPDDDADGDAPADAVLPSLAAGAVAVASATALPQVAAAAAIPVIPAVAETAPAFTKEEKMADVNSMADDAQNTAARVANDAQATMGQATDRGEAMLGDANARARQAMERSTRVAGEMTDLSRGNVEAMIEASRIAVRGFESIGRDAAEYGRRALEGATAAMKQMATAKSPTEMMKLQGDYARQSFDEAVQASSKQSEALVKLTSEIMQPLSNRVAVASEKARSVG